MIRRVFFVGLPLLGTLLAPACGSEDDVATTSGTTSATNGASTASAGGSGGAGGSGAAGGSGGAGGSGAAGGSGGAGGGGGAEPTVPTQADCSPPVGLVDDLKRLPVSGSPFNAPMGALAPWGDAERLFVFERAGRIQLVKNGQKKLFLDLKSKVVTNGEFGLLGVAFHPDYAKNGRFFVHYSAAPSGDTTIEEYRRSMSDPEVADPAPVGAPILTVKQPAANHDGGTIEFSPLDGYLYIGLGDGGGSCDTYKTGQNLDTLLGKVLRINVDTTPYSIPAGNFATGRPEIYINGLRNPFRMGFDVCTGELYIGDVGQGKREEIDIAPPGKDGLNFGWSIMEGSICATASGCNVQCGQETFDLPTHEYVHEKARCSITGGRVYRGAAIPWLRGAYLYGDFCTGEIWALRHANGATTEVLDLTQKLGGPLGQGLVAFGEDEFGELYIVHLGGAVERLAPGN